MSYLDRIDAANRHDLSGFIPFMIGPARAGWVRPAFAEKLADWPEVFDFVPDSDDGSRLALVARLAAADVDTRSAEVGVVVDALRTAGAFGGHWWDEPFSVDAGYGTPPLLRLERAALEHFGACGYGVHLNGYVRDGDKLKLWVARRALDKPKAPGKLDQLVAGGQPAGLSLKENMLKECAEEAAIPRSLGVRMVPVSAISYCLEGDTGLRPDVLFNFDLELPADFEPVNTDGEVEEFYLWSLDDVAERVRDGDAFKFNCSLVVIDFLIRWGYITPEHPDYLALQRGLRRGAGG